MFDNYLVVAWRNLASDRLATAVNVLGLGVGMAGCMLIALYIQTEVGYDRHHAKAARIYRVVAEYEDEGGVTYGTATTPFRLAEALQQELPSVEAVTRFYGMGPLVTFRDMRNFEHGRFADPAALEIFDLPLVRGDRRTALRDAGSIVVTEGMARRFFGEEDPLGQVLSLDGLPEHEVTGVLRDLPANSHLRFDFLASMAISEIFSRVTLESWRPTQHTYVLLPEGTARETATTDLAALARRCQQQGATFTRLELQPVTSIHLHSHLREEMAPNGSIEFVYLTVAIGVILLGIACLNYVNMVTARGTTRAREIGLRKAIGAHRAQLVGQFLGESVLLAVLVSLLAYLAVQLALPSFSALVGQDIPAGTHVLNLSALLSLSLFVGLVAGTYPALRLSGIRPAAAMRSTSEFAMRGGTSVRNGLAAAQLCVSTILIACTAVTYHQYEHLASRDLGFRKDDLVVVERSRYIRDREAFKRALMTNPAISNVTFTTNVPPDPLYRRHEVVPQGAPAREIWVVKADVDYFQTLGVAIVDGRDFSRDLRTDESDAVILNQAAVRELGWDQPVGKDLEVPYFDKHARVVGVVEDFHLESLYHPVSPVAFIVTPTWYSKVVVRSSHGPAQETMAFLRSTWDTFVPDKPFEARFLDDTFDRLYRAEKRQGQALAVCSAIAVTVACLGLFGLASFLVGRRVPEIGIRKLLGASTPSIFLLLSGQFLRPVVIGSVVAVPIAYWIVERWLQGFPYRVDVDLALFAVAGLLSVTVSWLALSYQTGKAAQSTPVEALRRTA